MKGKKIEEDFFSKEQKKMLRDIELKIVDLIEESKLPNFLIVAVLSHILFVIQKIHHEMEK